MSRRPPPTAAPKGGGGRLEHVLCVGLSEQKTRDATRCCDSSIDMPFNNLDHFNSYRTKNARDILATAIDPKSDDNVCAICFGPLSQPPDEYGAPALEALYEPITAPGPSSDLPVHGGCGHVFHRTCLRKWVVTDGNATCPVCRTQIPEPTVTFLTAGVYEARDPESGRLMYKDFGDGVVQYFDGPVGEERSVKMTHPRGQTQVYKGPKGQERLVEVKNVKGQVQTYTGPKGEERKVTVTFPSGEVHTFTGPKGEERLVRVTLPDGTVQEP